MEIFKALDNFSCDIPKGITGILGPNGAGKTTLIRCLLNFHLFQAKKITVLERYQLPRDISQIKDIIGYMSEKETRMIHCSAVQFVSHFGRLGGLPHIVSQQRASDVLHYVGLEEAMYRKLITFSSGMLQRVKLATALVHDPEILILDEPTSGLDPIGRNQVLNLINDLGKNHSKNILISTHLLPDVEKTSQYIVVISQGKLVMQGNLKTILKHKGDKITLRIVVSDNSKEFAGILKREGFEISNISSEITCIIDKANDSAYSQLFKLASSNKIYIQALSTDRISLEEIFLKTVNSTTGGKK